MTTPKLLTPAEVAAKLQCCAKTVRGMVEDGRLTPCKIGRGRKRQHRRFSPEVVERLVREVGPVRRTKLPPVPEIV